MFKTAVIIKKYNYLPHTDYRLCVDGDYNYVYRISPRPKITQLFITHNEGKRIFIDKYIYSINAFIPLNETHPIETINRLIKLQLLT